MPITTWMGLFLCNAIWAINPSVAKRMIQEIGPEHTALLRYSVAFIAYVVIMLVPRLGGGSSQSRTQLFMPLSPRKDFLIVLAIGFATCFLSPLTQMFGLEASSATNNSILITFEPIFALAFSWLIFGEKLTLSHYLSFFLATTGFLLLSNSFTIIFGIGKILPPQTSPSLAGGFGDVILLVAVAGEALYTVLARLLTKTYSGPRIFGTAMGVGVLLLSLAILPWRGLPPFHQLSATGWLAVFWLGVLGTTLPYLYWLYALKQSLSMGSIVLSLFLQPLIGSCIGVSFLKEPTSLHQITGGFMITVAVLFQVLSEKPSSKGLR